MHAVRGVSNAIVVLTHLPAAQIVEHLSKDLRVQLNWAAREIVVQRDTGLVRVVATDGRVLTATAVIVTVPPPVRAADLFVCCHVL